jgi:pimeloyl-ACP methyl ester carboxylesterase
VLSGPFARKRELKFADKAIAKLFAIPGLNRIMWKAYWPKFFGSTKPADFESRRSELKRNLAERGRFAAILPFFYEDHAESGRALAEVNQPALIVMGDADPDFPDPVAQAQLISDEYAGQNQVVIVPGAGHYPHSERVDVVAPAVIEFLHALDRTPCPE